MSRDMYDDGYKKMINTDYSPVIIDLMRKRNQNCDGMSWEVMDINNLEYNEASFECILEKGTLDALLVDEKDPWKLSEENEIKLDKILERVRFIIFLNIFFSFMNQF
jgi:hypothetical protein